jgi:hypothetical protein
MLLKANFLWDSGLRLITRLLVALLTLARSFLARLCVDLLLGTYTLNSLERGEKRTHVQWHHAFLVEIVLVLPHKWAHS